MRKGSKHSEKDKRKMSESHKGKILSEEHKKKIGKSNKDKKHSKETRKKISESHKGIKHSERTKIKISKSLKGRIAWNKGNGLHGDAKKEQKRLYAIEYFLSSNQKGI
jgi:hypothetical protein